MWDKLKQLISKWVDRVSAGLLIIAVLWSIFAYPWFDQVGCLRTGPNELRWITIFGEAGILIAYLWIPVSLVVFWLRLRVRPEAILLILYGGFIVSCGLTHGMGILMFFMPYYWLAAKLKILTAAISLTVARVTAKKREAILQLGEQAAALRKETETAIAAKKEAEEQGAEAERQRAEAVEQRAEADRQRTEADKQRAEAERHARETHRARLELEQANQALSQINLQLEGARAQEAAKAAQEAAKAERLGVRNADLESMIRRLEAQDVALRSMESPILEANDRTLLTPLVGTMSSFRAADWTQRITERAHAMKASNVVIDVTGLVVVDTAVADAIIRTARTIRMIGSRCILTGMRPEVASTLVNIGVDLGDIETFGTLRQGLETARK